MAERGGVPRAALLVLVFLFLFLVFVEILVLIEVLVFKVGRLLLFFLLRVGSGTALFEFEVDSDVAELGVEELHELVGVVARPLVEQVGQELEEIPAVETTLDLLDLIFGERLENVFAQRLDVALLDRVLRRQADLTNGALVEVDLHRFLSSPSMRTALELSTPVCAGKGRAKVYAPNGAMGELRTAGWFASVCGFASAAIALSLGARAAYADDASSATVNAPIALPPPSEHSYLQYGVALSAEIVAFAGPACSDTGTACILGSGGGIVARAGWRRDETLYIGGAYEMSKQDPHQLYRLGLLQQARAEFRRYVPTGRETAPFFMLGVGVGAYGNEWWPVDTWGPSAMAGGGIEVQLGGSVFIVSLAYRPMYFQAWTDSSTLSHDSGIAHFVGLEAAIEKQDTL
jgi:hypothetical protein